MMEIRLKSTYLELLFVCLCLMTVRLGPASGQTVVRVKEGSEAVLPCLIRPERDITRDLFDWRKVVQKATEEVFMYNKGKHYNNGLTGQDEQFKGRVSHFPDQLQFSNASIVINNTKLSDSGTYTCDFSPDDANRQTFNIVVCILKDRSKENIRGASLKPHIRTLYHTKDKAQLQCEVRGVSPKPEVEWQDSSGNILHADEPQITERGGSYNIILKTTVTKTDNYRCVVTQEEICHQVSAETAVYIHGGATKQCVTILEQTKNSALLQCEVRGASPKPKVKWQDSSGNNLTAEEPKVTEKDGIYDIILNMTVKKAGKYQCVATQEEINHQTKAEIYVHISGPEPPEDPEATTVSGSSTGWSNAAFYGVVGVGVVVVLLLLLLVFYIKRREIKRCFKGPQTETERNQNGDPDASDKQGLPQSVVTDGDGDEQREPTELDELNKSPLSSGNKKSEGDEEEKL